MSFWNFRREIGKSCWTSSFGHSHGKSKSPGGLFTTPIATMHFPFSPLQVSSSHTVLPSKPPNTPETPQFQTLNYTSQFVSQTWIITDFLHANSNSENHKWIKGQVQPQRQSLWGVEATESHSSSVLFCFLFARPWDGENTITGMPIPLVYRMDWIFIGKWKTQTTYHRGV